MHFSITEVFDFITAIFRAAKESVEKRQRIEGLVVIAATILLLMSILDTYRHRSRRLKLTLLILDTVTSSIVVYTIGLIQDYSFNDEVLPQVWAVLLTTLKQGIDYISAYSVDTAQTRRTSTEVRNIMDSIFVAKLNITHSTGVSYLIWILWSLNCAKIIQRIICFESAIKSYGIGRNSILVASYMKYEHELSLPEEVNPALVSGYKYLVLGEDKQKVEPEKPDYLMKLKVGREDRLITLDKIWQCDGRLLSVKLEVDEDGKLKDLCLSFAMYKLLRRRFDGVYQSQEPDHSKHHNLFIKGLISDGFERPFRIVEVELAFLSDFFHTRYPIIFSKGLPLFDIVIDLLVGGTCCFAVVVLSVIGQLWNGVGVGTVITLLLLIAIALREFWEMITYISSDWAKVVLLCKYVEKPSWRKFACVEKVLNCLCCLRVTKRWHGKIGQYSLLKSFNYKPWNLGYKLTLGLVNTRVQGGREDKPIRLSDAVKEAVLNSLILSNCQLTNGKFSLERNNKVEISWALKLATKTHSIMVWHIATSLCEIDLLQKCKENNKNLTRLEKYLKKLRSCATCIKNWWRPLPFYVNMENLQGNLQYHYEIAASLSRYCVYLVVFRQDLLPDPSEKVEYIFGETISEAREFFKGHGSLKSQYDEMMKAEQSETIISKGVKLGKELIALSDEIRWKVLAEFWSEWILYMAPSNNTRAHVSALAEGGEFITHLWALLSHAGILEQPETSESVV